MLNCLLNVLNLFPPNFHTTSPLANTVLCRRVTFLPSPEHIIPICSMLFLLQRNPSMSLSDKILLFQLYRILSPPESISPSPTIPMIFCPHLHDAFYPSHQYFSFICLSSHYSLRQHWLLCIFSIKTLFFKKFC